jgi:hypothetical protein
MRSGITKTWVGGWGTARARCQWNKRGWGRSPGLLSAKSWISDSTVGTWKNVQEVRVVLWDMSSFSSLEFHVLSDLGFITGVADSVAAPSTSVHHPHANGTRCKYMSLQHGAPTQQLQHSNSRVHMVSAPRVPSLPEDEWQLGGSYSSLLAPQWDWGKFYNGTRRSSAGTNLTLQQETAHQCDQCWFLSLPCLYSFTSDFWVVS